MRQIYNEKKTRPELDPEYQPQKAELKIERPFASFEELEAKRKEITEQLEKNEKETKTLEKIRDKIEVDKDKPLKQIYEDLISETENQKITFREGKEKAEKLPEETRYKIAETREEQAEADLKAQTEFERKKQEQQKIIDQERQFAKQRLTEIITLKQYQKEDLEKFAQDLKTERDQMNKEKEMVVDDQRRARLQRLLVFKLENERQKQQEQTLRDDEIWQQILNRENQARAEHQALLDQEKKEEKPAEIKKIEKGAENPEEGVRESAEQP